MIIIYFLFPPTLFLAGWPYVTISQSEFSLFVTGEPFGSKVLSSIKNMISKLYFAIDRKIYKSSTKEKVTELLILG